MAQPVESGRKLRRPDEGIRHSPAHPFATTHPYPWRKPGPLPPVGALALARERGLPVLIVHGDADAFFPLEHPEALAGAAPGVQTWIEPGFGHAEGAIEIDLLRRIGAWTADR